MRVRVTQEGTVLRAEAIDGDDPGTPVSWYSEPLASNRAAVLEALRAETVAAPVGLPAGFTVITLTFVTEGLGKAAVPDVAEIIMRHLPKD